MTLLPLADDFPLMAPPLDDGTRLSLRAPFTVPSDEQLLELHEERDRRRAAYPRMVADRRLAEDAAARHQAVLAAIVEDVTPIPPGLAPAAYRRAVAERDAARAACRVTWDDKVRELRRELALRRNVWPKWIAARRLPLDQARQRMERIEAVHWRFWIAGEAWHPVADPLTPAARAECRALLADREAWIWQAHLAGDRAVAGYLQPPWVAWHEADDRDDEPARQHALAAMTRWFGEDARAAARRAA